MITADRLRYVLDYDPLTGVMQWRVSLSSTGLAGTVAGYLYEKTGYVRVKVDGRLYLAHRLAWLHHYGVWPSHFVDHINRVRNDNRLANLREATKSQNNWNAGLSSKNTSGFKGVCWFAARNRWMAKISVQNRTVNLGYFDSPEAAHEAYISAARTFRGEFARSK